MQAHKKKKSKLSRCRHPATSNTQLVIRIDWRGVLKRQGWIHRTVDPGYRQCAAPGTPAPTVTLSRCYIVTLLRCHILNHLFSRTGVLFFYFCS